MKRVALILLALCASLNAATYYVDNTGGSNSNNGLSTGSAWLTIQKACSTMVAGDTVFIRSGTYDEKSKASTAWGYPVQVGLVPNNSGTAGNEIVFKGYPGETRPLILGKSPHYGAPNSTDFRMGALLNEEHHLIYDSLEFRFGPSGFFLQGGGPHDIIIRNCVIDSMLGLGGDRTDIGCGQPLDDNAGAIVTYYEYGVYNLIVEGCEIFACGRWEPCTELPNYRLGGNTGGMWLYNCTDCIFRNNRIHDVLSGIRFKEEALWSEVYGNTFYNIGYASMWLHSGQKSYTGSEWVMSRWHHNISYNSATCILIGEGTGGGTQADTLAYLYNNTCDCSNSAQWADSSESPRYGGLLSTEGGWGKTFIFNNIFYNVPAMSNTNEEEHRGAIVLWSASHPIFTVYEDYNMLYGQGTGQYYAVNSSEYTLSSWVSTSISQILSGHGVHSVIDDPEFTNAGTHDYSIASSSPAATGGKGGSFTFWPGTSRATTVTLDTYFGALAPDSIAITDTCIQITGKTSLGYSDTCYCIVDSLVINYANRDTIIRTNSKDNIRIWGYHTGGGRAIVRYNLDDAGTLSSHSDSPLISPLFYVSGTDGIKISNIAIVPGTVDDSIWQFTPMSFQTSENIEVSACSTVCAGFSSRGMYSPSGTSSYNFWIHDNYFGTISKGYNRRDAMYGTMIHLEGGFKSATGYQYLAKITHNRINTIHTGIGITGGSNYPVVYLDSNTITVDARDDLHMTYDDNDGNNSAGDPYGINIGGCDSLSHIIGNTFASGSSYYGGDGMILQNVNASKTDRMEVYSNVMNLHHGPHPRIAAGRQAVVGVYARDLVRGLHYHNNLGYLIVDEDGATNSYGIYGEGARITMTDSGSSYNLIENNHYSVVAKDSVSRTGAGTFKVSGLSFIQVDSLIAGHHDVKENLSTNNYWRSPRTPIWGGCTRTQGFNNALISKDTVYTIYDGDSTFFSFEQLGTYDGHSVGNALQDMILLGYANQSDVYKGTISSNADSLGKQLSYIRSLTVNFKNSSSANIDGGTIWAVDAYGHRHDMPNSNTSGNSSDTLRWRFFGYDALTGDGYAVQDSNAYNNFTFWGKSGSDSASTAATINWTTSQLINVQLSGETTPPAAIKTLRGLTLKGVTIK